MSKQTARHLVLHACTLYPGDRILDGDIRDHMRADTLTVKRLERIGSSSDYLIHFEEPVRGDFGPYFAASSYRRVYVARPVVA
jgi:hypothetical protein